MTENPSTSYGNYDILDKSVQQGLSFAPGVTDGIKVNSPRPTSDFKKAADKPINPATYGGQDLISQFLINILMLLTGMLDPDKQGNDKLVSMISKAFGMEDDANHTQYRELRQDIQTRGKDAVRDDMDYSRFEKGSALEAVRLGKPILGKNIYDSQMLELIGMGETGDVNKGIAGDYNRVYGKAKRIDLTDMSIDEVIKWQKQYTDNGSPSSAAGKYQVIRKTLEGAVKEMGLNGDEKFDEAMQDRIAMHLLKKRGYEAYLSGDMKQGTFVNKVAHEWASFKTTSGRGAYDGDGLNSAKVSVGTALAAAEQDKTTLKTSFTAARDNVKPEEPAQPRPLVLAAAAPEAVTPPPYRPLVLAPTPG